MILRCFVGCAVVVFVVDEAVLLVRRCVREVESVVSEVDIGALQCG